MSVQPYKFDLEQQFLRYLKQTKQTPAKMAPGQLREMRRVYFGACGHLLALLRDEVAKMPEEDGVVAVSDLWTQVGNFWARESLSQN